MLVLIALGLPVCSGGCGKSGETGTSPSATASTPGASTGVVGARDGGAMVGWPMNPMLRRAPGVAGGLLRAAHELSLSEEEKASVTKVEQAFLAEGAGGMTAAMNTFQTDLAAGIRAGKLDGAKLSADYAVIDKAAAATQGSQADAIAGLHAALTPAERQQVAASVRQRRALRDRLAPPGGADAAAPDYTRMRVDRLTRDLAIDVDGGQERKLTAVVAADAKTDAQSPAAAEQRREEQKKRVETILVTFEGDALDAAALPLGGGWTKSPHEGAERTATFDASLLPLLTQEQRDKLAVRMQRFGGRPGRFPEDGPMHGGFENEEMGPMMPMGPLGR